jgi:CheY-like chemotaxis protein
MIKILFADDDIEDRKDIVYFLNRDLNKDKNNPDCEVKGCDLSPFEIRNELERYDFKILLLDVSWKPSGPSRRSPGREIPDYGLNILREMLPVFREKDIKIILVTVNDIRTPNSNLAKEIQKVIEDDLVQGYILKPYRKDQMIEVIESLIAK